MGDDKRGPLFARLIVRQFPKAERILVVADGRGQVARSLANKKRSCIVIEKEPRWEGPEHKRVRYLSGIFSAEYSKLDVDLIVGMHPDEATAEIIKYADKYNLPFAVCPCCIKGIDAVGVRKYQDWLNRLKTLAPHHNSYWLCLHMEGKNDVLVGKRR
jgi:hypothetical protein